MEKHPDDKKPVVEYTAKITLPNGEVIEKTVSTEGDFPSLEEFDLSTRDGLLRDFDLLEKLSSKPSESLMGNCPVNIWTPRLKKSENKSSIHFIGSRVRTDIHSCIWLAC